MAKSPNDKGKYSHKGARTLEERRKTWKKG